MSTGNDIVALAATDADRTCGYRFYSRILTPNEKQHYNGLPGEAGLAFSQFVWLLWSIKESTYKFCSRYNRRLAFAPLKIGVERLSRPLPGGIIQGMARFQGMVVYSRSWLTPDLIYTVVSDEPGFDRTGYGVHRIDSTQNDIQSAKVRELALAAISLTYPGAALRIVKTPDGPPEVFDGNRQLDIPVSLAHHDRWVAYSYRLPTRPSPDYAG